jgi:hypothetical protein
MTWWKRTPVRHPHPDPARELELRRILDLRASIDRRIVLITQYRLEIGQLLTAARNDSNRQRIDQYLGETRAMEERINAAEDAIAATGEDIAKLQALIPPGDLSFLW